MSSEYKGNFYIKTKFAQMTENCLLWREKAKKIRRETVVFGGSGGSATVSSQYYRQLSEDGKMKTYKQQK